MVIEIQNGIMNSQSSYLFSNERFDPEERPVMKIQDSDVYSENHFGSHLLGTVAHCDRDT